MLPLENLPASKIRAVFSDLDGTLTDEPAGISAQTYQSLVDLKNKGLAVVLVSGRPAGWSDALMRLWPLDAMIFENGAGIMLRKGRQVQTVTLAATRTISEQRQHLESIFQKMKQQIAELKLASDQPFRRFDYAIDYAEEPPFLAEDQVEMILRELKKEKQITAKLSSIHINYWWGTHTKVTACQHLLKVGLGHPAITHEEVLFCGDSPNDEPLFGLFTHSVGVANVQKFLKKMTTPPKYVTNSASGAGFVEIAQRLLKQAS